MGASGMTLGRFFEIGEKALPKKRLSEAGSSAAMSSLKVCLATEAKWIDWPTAFGGVVGKLKELLDIDIVDVMAWGWERYGEIRKYADGEKYPPDETYFVPIAEGAIRSVHRPYVEITINETVKEKVTFDVVFTLSVKGVVLGIQGGRIRQIRTGSCKGKGTVKLGNVLLAEKETEPIELPGSIDLGEGIALTG